MDLRGVPVSSDLLQRILDRLRDGGGRPQIQRADFTASVFPDNANFDRVDFHGLPRFDGATFGAGASFTDARFLGDASFSAATFGERASFIRAVFEAEAMFPNASFGWGTTFSEARFNDDARFEDATFGQGDPAFQRGVSFDDTEFTFAGFSRTTFRNGAGFERARFAMWGTFDDTPSSARG